MLSTAVAASAQVAPLSTDSFKAQIAACSAPPLTDVSASLTGEAATEAHAAYLEASNAIAETVGMANFKLDEIAAEATAEEDPSTATADLTAELTAFVAETCQSLAELRTEYNATIAELTAAPANTTENDKPEVKVQQTEQPEVDKQEVKKPEQEKSDSSSND